MRLQQYLNEKKYRKEAVKKKAKAKRIINKRLADVYKELKWLGFNVSVKKLCMIMSSLYHKENVRFEPEGRECYPSFKYVKGGDLYRLNKDVDIFFKPEVVDFIRNNQKKKDFMNLSNKLNSEMIYALAHVLADMDKIAKLKDDFQWIGYQPLKEYIIKNFDYYAKVANREKQEDGISPTRSIIYDLVGNIPVYKEFKQMLD